MELEALTCGDSSGDDERLCGNASGGESGCLFPPCSSRLTLHARRYPRVEFLECDAPVAVDVSLATPHAVDHCLREKAAALVTGRPRDLSAGRSGEEDH